MKKYDIIVIGAGSGGLNIAMFMNKAGFKTLLVDKTDKNIGGDCLNFGCVPSKALIHVSKIISASKKAKDFGMITKGNIDIKKVLAYVESKQDVIREHENANYFRDLGIDVELGMARFTSKNEISISDGKTKYKYKAKKIVLATGSRPRKLEIKGIEEVAFLTNETIFDSNNFDEIPKNLLVIGAGPIGIELGQAFQNLGSKVTVVQKGEIFLPKERNEISEVLLKKLKKEGMEFMFNSSPIEFISGNEVVIETKKEDGIIKNKVKFDKILISIGRILNTEGLDLEKAGIEVVEKNGIKKLVVDKYLRTTNKNVFVCGDIAGDYQFTHAAELHANVILNNFFSPLKKKIEYDNLSWVTFTDPEIATFGLNEEEIKKRDIEYEKLDFDFQKDDRSIVTDYTDGKLILFISKKNKILGGTMIAVNAGEIFQELVLAKTADLNIKEFFNKIYAYPTASRVNKRIITLKFSGKLTDFNKKILKWLY